VTQLFGKSRRIMPTAGDLDLSPVDVPKIVTDTTAQRWSRRRFMGGAVSVAALGSFAAACSGVHPTASTLLVAPTWPAGDTSASLTAAPGVDAELISRRYAGLKPFAPASPPTVKPITLNPSDPTVFSHVPLTEKVVFVTIDDGLEKEPRFIEMVKTLQVPITISLANLFIRDDYAYFEKLYETGYVSIQNHTVNHPLSMPSLSEYGVTPTIFRPPGGNYNETTIVSAGQAGLGGVMLWKEAMEISDMQYQTAAHRLQPGDIILCHFRGPAQLHGETMVRMMTRLYKHIQAQGFTIGDLTKYV
jgi:hypothetical protein